MSDILRIVLSVFEIVIILTMSVVWYKFYRIVKTFSNDETKTVESMTKSIKIYLNLLIALMVITVIIGGIIIFLN